MKDNLVYGSIFLVITIIGMSILYIFHQNNYVYFDVNKIHITLDDASWTNKNVTVTVDYDGNMRIKGYSFDGGVTWQKSNKYTVNKNQKLEIVLKGSLGRKSTEVVYRVTNIDKELPMIEVDDIVYTAKGKEFDIANYYAVSDMLSGVKTNLISDAELINVNENGEYTIDISATDLAGNSANKTVKIFVVDKNDPNLLENKKDDISVTGVTVDKSKVILEKGKKVTVTPTIKPDNATNKKVTWKSANTRVAKVNSKGVITAVGAGSTTVSVTTLDGNKMSEIVVIVTD